MSESLPKSGAGRRIAILLVRVGVALVLSLVVPVRSPAQTPPPRDLTQFSLEDLMNVQVISVSKKEQKLAKTGAAIFVITQEDIRRSGATNIPDLLRMVPGVDVARVDPSSARLKGSFSRRDQNALGDRLESYPMTEVAYKRRGGRRKAREPFRNRK